MQRFSEGDRVRVDIPHTTDSDHDRLHGRHGTVTNVIQDAAGDERDSILYQVELEDGTSMDFRWPDLRPAD